MSKDPNSKRKTVLITVLREKHEWAKENISNFSGFVEKSLCDFSASCAVGAKENEPKV